jgi:hypothetical protein
MGIFDKIWGKLSSAATGAVATGSKEKPAAGAPSPSFGGVSGGSSSTAAPASTTSAPATVDVEAIMMDLERKSGHKSNWRTSIVDLMSLLGMDNSLAERKELAKELGYTGDMNDSASMNIWLHKQVMRKMAENGGKVPANMLD